MSKFGCGANFNGRGAQFVAGVGRAIGVRAGPDVIGDRDAILSIVDNMAERPTEQTSLRRGDDRSPLPTR